VLLSAQATDVSVNKATRKLYPVANTPRRYWPWAWTSWPATSDHRPVPHQGQERHRHLPDPARAARRRSAGSREALEALPGVGRKTANVV
jgi:endonuclease-3